MASIIKVERIHPKKFALWIGIVSMLMLFAALTSAYIVRKGAGNWFVFKMPDAFFYSTAVIVASSITLHGAYIAFKDEKKLLYRSLLVLTTILGIAFIMLQKMGWSEMQANGVYLSTNPSASFMYMLTGFHVAHVFAGIAALFLAVFHAFSLPFQVTQRRVLRLELTLTFWHFLDVLWVYLLLFFLIQQ